jgi:hypothetical protein
MDQKTETLRQLCRGVGVMDDEQFREAAETFGVDDLDEFNNTLVVAVELISDPIKRTVFGSALNLDNDGGTLESRRLRLMKDGIVPKSSRTIIRMEASAAELVAHSLSILLKHYVIAPH